MASVVVTHQKKTNASANPNVLVDGSTWDTDPHIVTGLDQIDNTSDVNKPVSTAQAAAIAASTATVTATSLGLGNVNNTSDVNKPVSTAQATADALVASNAAAATSTLSGTTATALALKAPLASPALTGVPVAPTASPGNNTTQLATTAYADAINTLRIAAEALKAPLASPALTGTPTAPTAAGGTNTTQLATTAFVIANAASAGVASIGTQTGALTIAGGDLSSSVIPVSRYDITQALAAAQKVLARSNIGAAATLFTNAIDFTGVDPTGATDSTTGIAAAIAATPSGGTLYFPNGNYLVSGSGAQIFTITTPINILGAGASASGAVGGGGIGTTFLLAAGVASTRDVFHVTGVLNNTLRGYSFKNYNVGIVSGTGGQNVFHFDSTAGTTTGFAEVVIDNVAMSPGASAGGNSVFLNNGASVNVTGGTFNFTIQKSYVGGGLNFLKAGDTLRVLDNIITGANAGVTSDQVSGAGQLMVIGNNITSAGGAVIVKQGFAPIIAFNEIESGATTEANNALIDITGSVASVGSAKIVDNQIQATSGTPTLIRVATATGAFIDGNRLSTPSSYAHIINTAAASGTVLGLGNLFVGGGADITDSGSGTISPLEAWVAYTPGVTSTLTGSFTAAGRFKQIGKTVFVNTIVTWTSASTGTVSVTLPTTSLSEAVIGGKEVALSGVAVSGFVLNASNSMSMLTAAGANVTTNGSQVVLTGSYEST